MSGSGSMPVDAQLVVRYASGETQGSTHSSRRPSVQGTSIYVADAWRGPVESETPETPSRRRLSASLRVCDLYQCVHSREGSLSGPKSECSAEECHGADSEGFNAERGCESAGSEGSSPRAAVSGLGSVSGDGETFAGSAPALRNPDWSSARSRNSSLSSSSQEVGSSVSPVCSVNSAGSNSQNEAHLCSHSMHENCWLDLSTPCGRHHHRRNSTAIKFRKALYEEPT